MDINEELSKLITDAISFGLAEQDVINAYEFLNHNEYGLCFDTVVTQLYEFDNHISSEFYAKISDIAIKMQMPVEDYSFLEELINSG